MIEIGDRIAVPERELRFTASRSSGPGGQNVNKTSTRVTLQFDIEATDALLQSDKCKIRERLATRISKKGILRIVCQRHRSQAKNRKQAIERFIQLLEAALEEDSPRIGTRIPEAAKRRRLEEKTRRGRVKQQRSRPIPLED